LSEDDIIYWQEVLDEVMAGRTAALVCPFCQRGRVELTEKGRLTRLECSSCHKFIEGALQSE
jgi:hypothetical protein